MLLALMALGTARPTASTAPTTAPCAGYLHQRVLGLSLCPLTNLDAKFYQAH
jgi:hypothetical protein